jgi:hypothetical protein
VSFFLKKAPYSMQNILTSRWMWFLKGLPSLPRARAMFAAKRHTMTTPRRCRALWDVCETILRKNVPGAFVECGVWKGGSAAIMGLALRHAAEARVLHLFDSFEGLPQPGDQDGEAAAVYSGGQSAGKLASIHKCEAGLAEVRSYLIDQLHLPEKQVRFHVGWFQNTIRADASQIGPIAALRLDGDWYESTRICLEHLYPLLSPGGVLILDDYFCWTGCRKATDEFRAKQGITAELHQIDVDSGFWWKEKNPGNIPRHNP